LLMAAGCAVMLVVVFALKTATNEGSWVIYLLLLLCPAIHYLIHRGMHGRKKPSRNALRSAADIRKRAVG
jgi:hypothetical protein